MTTYRVIRKDVKKMNNKFDHLETSVRQLKPDSNFFKDQSAHLTKQVNELKSYVSKLESQNRRQELIFAPLLTMKIERLEAQSPRDNIWFMGSMIKVMNLGKNRRPECVGASMNTFILMMLPSKSKERIVSEIKFLND